MTWAWEMDTKLSSAKWEHDIVKSLAMKDKINFIRRGDDSHSDLRYFISDIYILTADSSQYVKCIQPSFCFAHLQCSSMYLQSPGGVPRSLHSSTEAILQ